MNMRVAVTGASGFIGQNLVRALAKQGHDLVLFGRDVKRLERLFPGHRCCDYTWLPNALTGTNAIFHLAAAMPAKQMSCEEFTQSNAELTKDIALAARVAEIDMIVNFATLGWNNSAYSRSKKKAEEILSQLSKPTVKTLRLPAVYSDEFRGRLSVLNKFPSVLRPIAFQFLAAFRPTVRMEHVVAAALDTLGMDSFSESIISDRQHGNWFYYSFKILIDYCFALSVIVFFWWLIAIIYIAVRFESSGPGIFKQTRVGRFGKPFTCYKFRTMHVGTKTAGTHEVPASSVTGVGRILRKTKLDELPQVINILAGQISLVGPRPCLPVQKELIAARQGREIHTILPGITGYAQVNGIDMSDPVKLAEKDAEYLALRSIPMDLRIFLATLVGRGAGDRVG